MLVLLPETEKACSHTVTDIREEYLRSANKAKSDVSSKKPLQANRYTAGKNRQAFRVF